MYNLFGIRYDISEKIRFVFMENVFISSNSENDEERELKKVHLTFDLEAAELLPLVVK